MNQTLEAWEGEFGNAYIERNGDKTIQSRAAMWRRILRDITPGTILEVGANIGLNIRALQKVTGARLLAVEPNNAARRVLKTVTDDAYDGTADKLWLANDTVNLVATCGVLIHIHPDDLADACAEMYRVSNRYIVCIEYFSDKPEEIEYRGQSGMLWKRDFGSFWMEQHPDLKLLDYGFFWKRATGLDNLTWWLWEK
jgi:pseudaminic acid biosynthesis-associated methylase